MTKDELPRVADASHGVLMERVGASGLTANQHSRSTCASTTRL
ncbi:MAG: hypothetical protein ACLR7Z_13020 [Bilophila wadsworthia]